jgi:capsid protein
MDWGERILVFDMATRSWVPFEGTVGQWIDSLPFTEAEAAALTADGRLN